MATSVKLWLEAEIYVDEDGDPENPNCPVSLGWYSVPELRDTLIEEIGVDPDEANELMDAVYQTIEAAEND